MPNPKIAVVILNWNGKEMMRRFLPSVVNYSVGAAEVIVADNGSTDGSLEMLAAEFPTVRRLPLAKNYGFAQGYNEALRGLEADYYLLLNSDVEVTPDWLAPMLNYMEEHPETAACQPKLLCEGKRTEFEYAGACGGYIDRYGYPFCRGRVFGVVETDKGQYDSIAQIFWATGAALMIRRADWEAVGGLDGRFFAHMEEIDLCWRLRARGRGIVCVPQSTVYHVGGGTLAQHHPRKTFLNFRNNLLLLYKNLPDRELKRVMRVRSVLDIVAACSFLISPNGIANFKAVFQARREFRRIRADFADNRRENLQHTLLDPIPEQLPCALLRLFHMKRLRTFAGIARYF